MKKLPILILLTAISCALVPDYLKESESARFATLSVPLKKLYIVIGQSNVGMFTTAQLGTVDSVKAWNFNTKVFDNYLDVANFKWAKGGVIVPLAERLQDKYPTDDLYFYQLHKEGTNLYYQWNPDTTLQFKQLIDELDKKVFKNRTFDEVWVVYIQGEEDSKYQYMASAYQGIEYHLLDSLQTKYNPVKIYRYNPPSTLPATKFPYRTIVRAAKFSNETAQWPICDGTGMNFNADAVHLTPTLGIVQLADSIMIEF